MPGIHHVETGELLAGRYKVDKLIGQGGMGCVYRGYDTRTDRDVAIKVLNPELAVVPSMVRRFRNEVTLINRVDHDGIATIHDCSLEEERPVYIILEYLKGQTLREVLGDPAVPLHPQLILNITSQILDVLATVHEQNIIHRDLKPENVFVLPRGPRRPPRVKLIDFGIAVFSFGGGRLTQVGTVLGTPFYMSPEQCQALPTIDHRADLYAVGILLYEMATGRLPFPGTTMEEIQLSHIREIPPRPSEFNPELFGAFPDLEAVIDRAIQKSPAHRFQTAENFIEALKVAIPKDESYFQDSQLPTPVNGGKSLAAPSRVAAVDATNAALADVSATPTRQLDKERPQAGIALARTMTPADLERATEEEVAHQFAKNFGVWIRKPSLRTAMIAIGGVIFATVVLILLATYLPNTGKRARTADAGVEVSTTAVIVPEKETPPANDQRDVLVIPIPVPVPVPRDDAATDEPNEVNETDATETAADAGPPDGYAALIATAKRARNWRTSVSRLEEATRLWPEGPDAWEELGNVFMMHGEIRKAREAFRTCLDLLPPDAFVQRAQVEGRLRGLQ